MQCSAVQQVDTHRWMQQRGLHARSDGSNGLAFRLPQRSQDASRVLSELDEQRKALCLSSHTLDICRVLVFLQMMLS